LPTTITFCYSSEFQSRRHLKKCKIYIHTHT
jgi:hypothetical protein